MPHTTKYASCLRKTVLLTCNCIAHTAKKAKAFISLMLQRGSTPSSSGVTTRGTIDFVYSGSRVKVLLPTENCVLQLTLNQVRALSKCQYCMPACLPACDREPSSHNFLLFFCTSKVRCPLPSRGASASAGAARVGEPFAEEAKAFTRKNLMHRQVRAILLVLHNSILDSCYR